MTQPDDYSSTLYYSFLVSSLGALQSSRDMLDFPILTGLEAVTPWVCHLCVRVDQPAVDFTLSKKYSVAIQILSRGERGGELPKLYSCAMFKSEFAAPLYSCVKTTCRVRLRPGICLRDYASL